MNDKANIEAPIDGELVSSTALAQFDEFEQRLQEFEGEYGDVVYDLTDPEQDRRARSDRLRVAKVISALDARHREVKSPLLEATRLVDGRRKAIKDRLAGVRDHIKDQIDAHEQREADRIEALAKRVEDIRQYAAEEPSHLESLAPPALLDRIRPVDGVELDDSWQEFKSEAALAQTETLRKLKDALEVATRREDEAAELARLRAETEARERADREERIRQEAEEKAKREAEEAAQRAIEEERAKVAAAEAAQRAAEREQREVKERAAREAKEAEQAAADAREQAKRAQEATAKEAARLERERIEAQRAAEEQVEAKRLAAEEKKKARREHRAKIHGEAKASLVDVLGQTGLHDLESASKWIVEAIRDGHVAHVLIEY